MKRLLNVAFLSGQKKNHCFSFYLINLRVIPFYNRATPVSIRIRMEWIHLAEDYMDNMGQFAPNQGVDPALIHFDVNVYWFHSKSSEALKDKLRRYFHR